MNPVEQVIVYATPFLLAIIGWMIHSWVDDVRETLREHHHTLTELEKAVAFLQGKGQV